MLKDDELSLVRFAQVADLGTGSVARGSLFSAAVELAS
jgi:hypothetical protein